MNEKLVVVVERDRRRGVVLERALENHGWTALIIDTGRAVSAAEMQACDAVLLVLDDDDLDIFEMLVRLSSLPQRPSVVLLTRRANAIAFTATVLSSLGVDRLVSWPCRVDQLATALDKARAAHEPMRAVP